jgi:hypothetical protein
MKPHEAQGQTAAAVHVLADAEGNIIAVLAGPASEADGGEAEAG